MIAIIDYGMGNIHSVNKALGLLGARTVITNDPKKIIESDKIVLPGVGAIDDAQAELERQGLVSAIKQSIKDKKPFLGICLGMQLLFEQSEEAKKSKGLGLLRGKVVKFIPEKGRKVPHMGWNQLNINSNCPLFKDVPAGAFVYFCHSYYPNPADKETVATTTDYINTFASSVWKDNLFGVQFHPEKSQKTGLKILDNFVNLC